MAVTSDENLRAAAEIPQAPPTPEVKVRTMKSDLESMSRPGGAPQFKSVKAPELPAYDETATEQPVRSGVSPLEEKFAAYGKGQPAAAVGEKERGPEDEAKPKTFWPVVLIAIVALVVLAAVAYMAYNMFFGNSGNAPASPAGGPAAQTPTALTSAENQTPAVSNPPVQTYVPPQSSANSAHATAFTKPVDQTLIFVLIGAAQNASELQTFSQRFSGIFSGANATSAFFEIDVKNADGSAADINGIFAAADTAVLDPQYVLAHFNPDATVFAYKDANGIWPGYVLKLKPTENWLYLKNDIAKLETKTAEIDNFFLAAHGAPSGNFKDTTVGDGSFRALAFTQPGATFLYGWYRGYLIMSTSVDGLREAMNRL